MKKQRPEVQNNSQIQRTRAKKALQKAKELEVKQRQAGKRYIQINYKTRVLR